MNGRLAGLLCIVLLSGFCAAAQPTPAVPTPADSDHSRKIAEIRKLMTLTGGDKMANQMLDQMAAALKASGAAGSDKFFDEFRKDFNLQKIFDLQVTAYDKYLSAEDVHALVKFYESPAGQRMIEAMPKIIGDMMQQGMEMSREIAEKAAKKIQDQQH